MTSLAKMPAIVLLTLALAACGQSAEQVGSSVLRSMQHKFTNDPELSKLRVAIAKVVVINGQERIEIATLVYIICEAKPGQAWPGQARSVGK